MTINAANIFAGIPKPSSIEFCQTLLAEASCRIERIVSAGHSSPKDFWYDQEQDEWVLVIRGRARLQFAGLHFQELRAGDYVFIPAHCRHRVDWTDPDVETVWLAVHIMA
ncbi:MAG: cupin domain-containing protein [Methylomonas sp.]|jgi:cupin 2 domain-containing protein